jgi:hypothetical protein
MQCAECDSCAEPWVLLGSVMIRETGLGDINKTRRRYIKPTACVCSAPSQTRPPVAAERKVEEKQVAAPGTPATRESPATPEAPAATETPATTETPETAETPATPETPATTETPAA